MTPLVLLAGMNCTADLWLGCGLDDAVTPHLDRAGVDDQVDALLAVLPPRFVLAGLSLGAIVAMTLAVRAPSRVAGLCLASTNAKAPTESQRVSWRSWIQRLDEGASPEDLQGDILDVLISPAARRTHPGLAERARAMGAQTAPATLEAQLRMQLTRTDLRPALAGLRLPTLVLSGERDALCPPAFHDEIVAAIPGSQLRSVDAGHLMPLERPDAFGAAVAEWRGVVSRAPSAAGEDAP
ncbi:alpha/beta fold hydrolase [Microbacterium radiodurans]|uniref:Alpha/beta fold hydrolase n=1 Tax=Microbacterium radiodurans TaxID=661398 RepID=A0A5J5IW09_9MICO|nr:alpha/beta fold hydrolase [Microbacterium radiodurans]KAA9089321.1 alpha/beta fold hydrolase [Microbacterium radiodurans]